jgi:hypothetical protein
LTCPKKRVVYALVARENENERRGRREKPVRNTSRVTSKSTVDDSKKPLSKKKVKKTLDTAKTV